MIKKQIINLWFLIPICLAAGSWSSMIFPLLSIKFNLINFVFILLLVLLISYYLLNQLIKDLVESLSGKVVFWVTAIFVFQLIIFAYAFRGMLAPHHNHDASDHVYIIQKIIKDRSNDPKTTNFTYQPSWYPLGFHSFVAGVCLAANNPKCVKLPWYLVTVFASFQTITVFLFAWKYFKNISIAVASSFVSVFFFLFPYAPFGWGGWSQLCGQVLIYFNIFLVRYYLMKEKPFFKDMLLLVLFITTLFYIHPTDFVTFVLLATIINFDLFLSRRIWQKKWFLYNILLVIICILCFLPGFEGGKKVLLIDYGRFSIDSFAVKKAIIFIYEYLVRGNRGLLIFFMFILGCLNYIVCFIKKIPYVITLYVSFVFILILAVLLQYNVYFYKLVYPFYPWGTPERILYSVSLSVSVISGVGLVYFIGKFKNNIEKYCIVAILLIIGFGYIKKNIDILKEQNLLYSSVTESDIQMFDWIKNNNLSGKLLTNPSNDSGAWINKFIDVDVYFPTSFTSDMTKDELQTLTLFVSDLSEEEIYKRLIEKNIKYVYKGSKLISGGKDYLNLQYLLTNKYLSLEKKIGETYLFRVVKVEDKKEVNPLIVDIGSGTDLVYLKLGDLGPIEESDGGRRTARWLTDQAEFVFRGYPADKVRITLTVTSFFKNYCRIYINNKLSGDFDIKRLGSFEDYEISGDVLEDKPFLFLVRCFSERPSDYMKTTDTRSLSIMLDKLEVRYIKTLRN